MGNADPHGKIYFWDLGKKTAQSLNKILFARKETVNIKQDYQILKYRGNIKRFKLKMCALYYHKYESSY